MYWHVYFPNDRQFVDLYMDLNHCGITQLLNVTGNPEVIFALYEQDCRQTKTSRPMFEQIARHPDQADNLASLPANMEASELQLLLGPVSRGCLLASFCSVLHDSTWQPQHLIRQSRCQSLPAVSTGEQQQTA